MSRFSQQISATPQEGVCVKATVKWFSVNKGFGFVEPEDGSPEAFLHVSVLNRAGHHEIYDGAEVSVEIAPGVRGPQVTRLVEVYSRGTPKTPSPIVPDDAPEFLGTVKWFKDDKGFGFANLDGTGEDVFIHKTVMHRCGLRTLHQDQRVSLHTKKTDKGIEAIWVTIVR